MAITDMIANSAVAAVISNPRLPDNPIIACNAAVMALTGYDREEILNYRKNGASRGAPPRTRIKALSPRQRAVLIAMARGRLNKQIAHELGLAERTVKMHRCAMFRAPGDRSRILRRQSPTRRSEYRHVPDRRRTANAE